MQRGEFILLGSWNHTTEGKWGHERRITTTEKTKETAAMTTWESSNNKKLLSFWLKFLLFFPPFSTTFSWHLSAHIQVLRQKENGGTVTYLSPMLIPVFLVGACIFSSLPRELFPLIPFWPFLLYLCLSEPASCAYLGRERKKRRRPLA